jgi:hypothetical protein
VDLQQVVDHVHARLSFEFVQRTARSTYDTIKEWFQMLQSIFYSITTAAAVQECIRYLEHTMG